MKDYQIEEWKRMVSHSEKSSKSSCPLIEDEVIVAVGDELKQLRADNKALRDYIASSMSTMPKIKADAVREAAEYLESCQSTSKTDFDLLSDYADKIERGEE